MRLKDALKTLYYDIGRKAVDREVKMEKKETELGDLWGEKVTEPPKSRYLLYLTLLTFIFFLVTIGIAYFVQYTGKDRTVSTSKIVIVTQGPKVSDSGSSSPLTIRVANRNPVPIREATLAVTYPEGSYKKGDSFSQLHREEFVLGTIAVGEVMNRSISPLFYGEAGEKKELKYTLEYRVEGSSEPVEARDSYEVLLRNSPIILHQPKYTDPVSGKEIVFTITTKSNSTETIPTVCIEMLYPKGFTPKYFSQQPSEVGVEKAVWSVQSLRSNRERSIQVRGIMRGEEDDEQALNIKASVAPTGECSEGVIVSEENVILVVKKSFFAAKLELNGKSDERIAVSPGGRIDAVLKWTNQDSSRLEDLVITVDLSGTGLDESSIRANDNGYFDEVRRQIVWDKKQTESLSSVGAGRSGEVSFTFRALPDRAEFAQSEKSIRVSVSAEARRAKTNRRDLAGGVAIANVNLRSNLQAVGNTLYATSTIKNTGPIPPVVGERTSYVLKYFIKNSGNIVSDFIMTVPLRRDVLPTGSVSGLSQGEWEYEEDSHAVVIRIPSIAAIGARATRSVELQVIVDPKMSDIEERIELAGKATYTATDTFTKESFEGAVNSLTTYITAEPLGPKSGTVVEGE